MRGPKSVRNSHRSSLISLSRASWKERQKKTQKIKYLKRLWLRAKHILLPKIFHKQNRQNLLLTRIWLSLKKNIFSTGKPLLLRWRHSFRWTAIWKWQSNEKTGNNLLKLSIYSVFSTWTWRASCNAPHNLATTKTPWTRWLIYWASHQTCHNCFTDCSCRCALWCWVMGRLRSSLSCSRRD